MKFTVKKLTGLIIILAIITQLHACKKEDSFLAAKPNQALAVPASLNDLQLLLNNETIFNRNYPALGNTSSDDILLPASVWLSDSQTDKNAYVWAKAIYPAGGSVSDWNFPYNMIFYANTVLDQLPGVKSTGTPDQYNAISGGARFYRAIALYNLMQLFAKPYDASTADADLGVPIVLTANLNLKQSRSSVAKCYAQIINDLNTAALLLPETSNVKTAPSKASVFALLSRTYLTMGDYTKALANAKIALSLYSTLQDFNMLNPAAKPMFPNFSPEEIFHAGLLGYTSNGRSVQAAPELFQLFDDPNDLRIGIYFRITSGSPYPNSQFDKKSYFTYSLSTNELILIKAECEVRTNNVQDAIRDLNSLLVTRWKTGTYKPVTTTDQNVALGIILKERRKELAFTGMRWTDLRRLNKEDNFAITLRRQINDQTYTLPPNDAGYILPIPDNEIQVNQMPQNPR